MSYFYLIAATLLNTLYSLSASFFNRKNEGRKDTSAFFNVVLVSTVVIGWAVKYIIEFSFNVAVLPYVAFFTVGYITGISGVISALKTGPIMLTNLIVNLSLLMGALWGLIFWSEPVTPLVIIGLVLVAVSIFLCLYNGKKDDKKVSLKWILYVGLAFFGNACCVITQKQQQIDFNGQYGNMLMLFSTGLSLIYFIITYLRSDKSDSLPMLKQTVYFPIASGLCNLFVNTFNIILATSEIPSSVVFPVISIGTLIIVSIFSLFVFKEKLRWWQWVGIILGITATILLSIK